MRLWIVVYDIADDRRRRMLVKVLAHGLARVQESVFEGWLTAVRMREILAEAAALTDPSEDRLRAYPLALRTAERYRQLGTQPPTPPTPDYWVV